MQNTKREKKPEKRGKGKQRLCDFLDIPPECLAGEAVVEICDGEVSVTGAKHLLECNEKTVVIETRKGRVRIEGEELEMQDFVLDRFTVKGKIRVVYPADENRGDKLC